MEVAGVGNDVIRQIRGGNSGDGPLSGFLVHQRDDETLATLHLENLLNPLRVEMAMVGTCQSAPGDEILI